MGEMSIKKALAIIDVSPETGQTFHIEYIKKNGEIGEIRKAIKDKRSIPSPKTSTKFQYNIKSKGVILIMNTETNEYRTLKIALLTHLNGNRILH